MSSHIVILNLWNKQIAKESDQIIAFWDGTSKGTQNIIGYAQRKGVPVRIIKF